MGFDAFSQLGSHGAVDATRHASLCGFMRFPSFTDVSPATRKVMQGNKAKDTKPEMIVRRLLHHLGYRYRLHRRDLPGRPDIVFGPRHKVILVHGCFWHGHECRASLKGIATRTSYWTAKIDGNRRRDSRNEVELLSMGWMPCVVWECETRDAQALTLKLTAFLDGGKACCLGFGDIPS